MALSALLAFGFAAIPVSAELPMEFWENNNRLIAALEQMDADSAVTLCNLVVGALEAEPESASNVEMAATKLLQTAELLEKCERYTQSAEFFTRYLPYAEKAGWADGVKIAKSKILQFTPRFEMYQKTNTPQSYYGAKHEPQSGIYYGVTSDSALADEMQGTSSVLYYHEYGDTNFDWTRVVLDRARERGQLVTFALNCPQQGSQITQIVSDTSYAVQLMNFLKQYSDLKIILRFGAEMNIWDNRANPEEFKTAFRLIADLARAASPNIAMMWSPYSTSSWDIDMNDYYPGDEYVDWVGCSLYSQKYFTGRNDWPEEEKFNEIVFHTGDSADPVLALNEIIEKYGARKPIALSESGVTHFTRSLGEDCTDWGLSQLEQIYRNIPMAYPQVKLINYFDRSLSFEVVDVALSTNARLKERYLELTQLPHFIQRGQTSAVTYHPLTSLMQAEDSDVYVYAHKFRTPNPSAAVLLNGAEVSLPAGNNMLRLNLSGFAPGSYQLQTVAGGEWMQKTVTLQQPLLLYLNGERIGSDVPPTIVNDSTMVPIRVISQALGASVQWNPADRSILVSNQGTSLSMQIDNPRMSKNGVEELLAAPPIILYDRTMVPLRAIGEALGIGVNWDAATRTVTLTK